MGSYVLPVATATFDAIGSANFKIIEYQQIQTDKQSKYIFRLVDRYRTSWVEIGTFGIFSFRLFTIIVCSQNYRSFSIYFVRFLTKRSFSKLFVQKNRLFHKIVSPVKNSRFFKSMLEKLLVNSGKKQLLFFQNLSVKKLSRF